MMLLMESETLTGRDVSMRLSVCAYTHLGVAGLLPARMGLGFGVWPGTMRNLLGGNDAEKTGCVGVYICGESVERSELLQVEAAVGEGGMPTP